jgi:hypothetical protein
MVHHPGSRDARRASPAAMHSAKLEAATAARSAIAPA